MDHLGTHIILELYDCPSPLLAKPEKIQELMKAAAQVMGATIIESRFHHFSPLGVSGVVIIMESHLTIHTWPEYAYAAVDIFTCGDIDLQRGVKYLIDTLKPLRHEQQQLQRGINIKPTHS